MLRDVIAGARMLAKTPAFTVFATLVLAIGIGANIALFSLITAILTKPLDAPNPDRLVRLYENEGQRPDGNDYLQYRDQAQSFTKLAAYGGTISVQMPVRLSGPSAPPVDMARPVYVSGNFFETVGMSAAIGRWISPADSYVGAEKVVVLSDEGWMRYFTRDPHVVGQTMFIEKSAFTIVGVASPSLQEIFNVGPEGWNIPMIGLRPPLFFIPLTNPSGIPQLGIIGRLKPGETVASSQADLSRVTAQLNARNGRHIIINVRPAHLLEPTVWTILALLISLGFAGVAIVLMIACDNIAILLLARAAARQHEIGIRLALGASRGQLIRQLLAENLTLSVLGGAGAVIVALLTARVIERLPLPLTLPDSFQMTFNWRVLLFAVLISFITTILFGLRPALHAVNKDVVVSLNPGSASGSVRHDAVRSALVVTQVAVCAALLITAVVLVRSQRLQLPSENSFVPSKVMVASVSLDGSNGISLASQAAHQAQIVAEFYEKLLPRLQRMPGIFSATAAEVTPAPEPDKGTASAGNLNVRSESGNRQYSVQSNNVAWQFFRTFGISMLNGRDFTAADRAGSAPVAIVNDALAQRLWPGQNAVGHWLRIDDGPSLEVVGRVHDGNATADGVPIPFLYRPLFQKRGAFSVKLMVRSTGTDARSIADVVQKEVSAVDATAFDYNVHTLQQEMDLSLLPNLLGQYIAGVPGALVLILGLFGTYGSMALLVSQRRREIGVRIALGATPFSAVMLILKEGMKWVAVGLSLGTIGALALEFGLSRFFTSVPSVDAAAFIFGLIVLATTAITACYIPAKRASSVHPIEILRHE